MQEAVKFIGAFMFAILFIATIGILAEKAFGGQEQFECQTWQAQAKTFKGFYLTKWQKAQCDRWQIKIEAPVQ